MRLRLESISHRFGGTTVLDDISFAVEQNEIVALLGPSGCGKSTLLGIAGGLLRQSMGRATLEGEPPGDSLNPITFVFQDAALLPWRTVADNIAFGFEHVVRSAEQRNALVKETLARVGLSDFASAYPKQLSGGMRQRVGIGRALAVNPSLLLMDEPLSALDAQTRELLMGDILSLWQQTKLSVLYVTHNIDEALRLANRIVVLSRRPGRIKEIVEIDLPQQERTAASTARQMSDYHSRIWSLIRDEATSADRQLISEETAL